MSGVLTSLIGSLGSKKTIAVNAKTATISTAAGTTLSSGAFATVSGNEYIVMLAWDPSGASVPTVTISDGTNTYTALSTLYPAPATTSAGTGVIIQAFIASVSTTASRTITATFSASITAKAMTVIELVNASSTQRNIATTSRGTTAAPNYSSPSGNIGDLILTIVGQETNIAGQPTAGATSTTGGTWSAISNNFTSGGSAATNIGIAYQYKILRAAGTQTNNWTMGSTNNWGSQSFAIMAA